MNAFGGRARHLVAAAADDHPALHAALAPDVAYELAQTLPPLTGRPSVARYEAIARSMRHADLVLTYDWGAIDGVMARRVFGRGAPPLVHHEDGLPDDERGGPRRDRNLYRRIALGAAEALVVPSRAMERIAREAWKQPGARVHRIPDGVDGAAFARKGETRAVAGLRPDRATVTIGAVAAPHGGDQLVTLVRVLGGLPSRTRLAIVGETPDEDAIRAAAATMGVADRVVLLGATEQVGPVLRHLDILAAAALDERFPLALAEGMAAALPIVAPRTMDTAAMVAEANLPHLVDGVTELRLRDALQLLALDPQLRRSIGTANRAKAHQDHDVATMIARYGALYGAALGRPGFLT